jgi:hypothetical protein
MCRRNARLEVVSKRKNSIKRISLINTFQTPFHQCVASLTGYPLTIEECYSTRKSIFAQSI